MTKQCRKNGKHAWWPDQLHGDNQALTRNLDQIKHALHLCQAWLALNKSHTYQETTSLWKARMVSEGEAGSCTVHHKQRWMQGLWELQVCICRVCTRCHLQSVSVSIARHTTNVHPPAPKVLELHHIKRCCSSQRPCHWQSMGCQTPTAIRRHRLRQGQPCPCRKLLHQR